MLTVLLVIRTGRVLPEQMTTFYHGHAQKRTKGYTSLKDPHTCNLGVTHWHYWHSPEFSIKFHKVHAESQIHVHAYACLLRCERNGCHAKGYTSMNDTHHLLLRSCTDMQKGIQFSERSTRAVTNWHTFTRVKPSTTLVTSSVHNTNMIMYVTGEL